MPKIVKKVSAKKVPSKKVEKPVKVSKTEDVKNVAEKVIKKSTKSVNLSIPIYSFKGVQSGEMTLPKEIFGNKINKKLLSQAVRVYSTNEKQMLGSTKTRGDIKASKVKIYRQKGTGKARHGAISAPIFVGGGISFGPQYRKVRLDLPSRMKKAALYSALSSKVVDQNIFGLTGADKATGKTKEVFELLSKINGSKKFKSTLIITGKREENVLRGVKNIQKADMLSVNLLNAYEVLKHEMLLITKEAVDSFMKPSVVKIEVKETK